MYRGGQLRDISEVSEVGAKTIQQFRHLGPFTHPLTSSPSVGHDQTSFPTSHPTQNGKKELKTQVLLFLQTEL